MRLYAVACVIMHSLAPGMEKLGSTLMSMSSGSVFGVLSLASLLYTLAVLGARSSVVEQLGPLLFCQFGSILGILTARFRGCWHIPPAHIASFFPLLMQDPSVKTVLGGIGVVGF